jgi:hypothetical protein
MKITVESTDEFVAIEGRSARLWKGTTGGGVEVYVFILSVAVVHESEEFQFAIEVEASGMHERMSKDTIEIPASVVAQTAAGTIPPKAVPPA